MNNIFSSLNKNQQSSQPNPFNGTTPDQKNQTENSLTSGINQNTGDSKIGTETTTNLSFKPASINMFGIHKTEQPAKTEEQQSSLLNTTGRFGNFSQPQGQTQNNTSNQTSQPEIKKQMQTSFNPILMNISTTNPLKNEATKANEQENKPVLQDKQVTKPDNPFINKPEGAKTTLGGKEENKNPTPFTLINTSAGNTNEVKQLFGTSPQGNASLTNEKSGQFGFAFGQMKGQQPTFATKAPDKQDATETKNTFTSSSSSSTSQATSNNVTAVIKDKPDLVPSSGQTSSKPQNTLGFPNAGSDITFSGASNLFGGGMKKETNADSNKGGSNAIFSSKAQTQSNILPKEVGEKTVPPLKKDEPSDKEKEKVGSSSIVQAKDQNLFQNNTTVTEKIALNQPVVSVPKKVEEQASAAEQKPLTVKAPGISMPTTFGGGVNFSFKADRSLETSFNKEKGKEATATSVGPVAKPGEGSNTQTVNISKPSETEKLLSKTEKKEASEAVTKVQEIKEELKLAEPKAVPENKKSLESLAIEAMSKKSIEDVINKWKSELDSQVEKFESLGDHLRNFEIAFQKNFESICSLNDLITNLKDEAGGTLAQMKDISTEEDQIIDQLNFIENSLDQYLEVADKRDNINININSNSNSNSNNSQMLGSVENKSYIYQTAIEISKTVNDIQKVIDEVNDKVSLSGCVSIEKKEEPKCKGISYENLGLKETLSLDKNEFTGILNSYYNSLRSIQFMEQNIMSKISQTEYEISQRKKEKDAR